MHHIKTIDAAQGKWRGILLELGVPDSFLKNKHGPCPLCGGNDRFRFDNKEGRGTYFCGQCGAGNGMDLALKFTGESFSKVASQIDTFVGNLKPEAQKPEMTNDKIRNLLLATVKISKPIETGALAHRYLQSRGISTMPRSTALRFAENIIDGEGAIRPAMLAMVGVPGEKNATIHRTFLSPHGGKAEMKTPRKLMPGEIPEGACVQLFEYSNGPLGIAEGIETACAASELFDMPVWAALNAGLLQKWTPPAGCQDVAIFGDNGASYTGQAVAYSLARKLSAKGVKVTVHIPKEVGRDWNDELLRLKPPQKATETAI